MGVWSHLDAIFLLQLWKVIHPSYRLAHAVLCSHKYRGRPPGSRRSDRATLRFCYIVTTRSTNNNNCLKMRTSPFISSSQSRFAICEYLCRYVGAAYTTCTYLSAVDWEKCTVLGLASWLWTREFAIMNSTVFATQHRLGKKPSIMQRNCSRGRSHSFKKNRQPWPLDSWAYYCNLQLDSQPGGTPTSNLL